MNDVPAVLGGKPAFSERLSVSQATVPTADAVAGRLREVLATGMVTNAKYVREFEARVAEYLGVPHAVAVSSNTTGLLLTLKCLGLQGDVIVPSFTFAVTGHALWWNRLRPVFVDIDPDTCLIDPDAIEAAITPQTSAILGVHIWGNPCAADRLQEIADRRGLTLLFDSAQAFGSRYKGARVGRFGRAEVFSCSPTKLVTCAEGGIVATTDAELARLVRIGRAYGDDGSYDCVLEGMNARLSELHAIVGLASLAEVEDNIQRRLETIDRYQKRLGVVPGLRFQAITPGGVPNGVYFTILVDAARFGIDRDALHRALAAENIDTRKYYYPPLHQQRVNAALAPEYRGRLPHTERVASSVLTLPLYSRMTPDEVDGVCGAIERVHVHRAAVVARLGAPVEAARR